MTSGDTPEIGGAGGYPTGGSKNDPILTRKHVKFGLHWVQNWGPFWVPGGSKIGVFWGILGGVFGGGIIT